MPCQSHFRFPIFDVRMDEFPLAHRQSKCEHRRLLTSFCSVLGSTAFAPVDTEGVEGAADDVVAHAREVAHATASYQYDAVLLEVVLFAGDVGGHFLAVTQAYASDFAQRAVGFLR